MTSSWASAWRATLVVALAEQLGEPLASKDGVLRADVPKHATVEVLALGAT